MTFCKKKLVRYLEGQGHSRTLQPNRVQPITLLCEVGFYEYFTEMITIFRRCVTRKFGSLPWRSRSQDDLAAKSCLAHYFVFLKFYFKTIAQKWSPYWEAVPQATFGLLPWRSRSQHGLAAKTCLAHNFIIWIRILQIIDRNDHHIEMICNYLAHSLALWLLHSIILSSVT